MKHATIYSVARFKDRQRAIALRLGGATYSKIRTRMKVGKSTLSHWLKNITLTNEQLEKINKDSKSRRIENYIKTTKKRRQKIIEESIENERAALGNITRRDLLIAGLFLYLGEGSKTEWFRVVLSNSDPEVINFWIFWLRKIIRVKREKIIVYIHLYKDMNIEKELSFWSKITKLPRTNFRKPYVKKATTKKINHWSHGHGTCNISVGDVKLKHRIMASIRIILENRLANKLGM